MHRLLRQHIACLRHLQDRAAVRHPDQHGAAEMRFWMRPVLPAAFLLLTAVHQAPAQDYSDNDLRDLRIGGKVVDLPAAGYVDFSCPADANAKPAGWSAWRDCPAGADGLHGLRFGFDPATSRDGT